MSERLAIAYRGYWDVPRIFFCRFQGSMYLFHCPFDADRDDYPDDYKVFLMPDLVEEELPKDWTGLYARAVRYLGDVPVSRVQFDVTRRQSIDSEVLDDLTARKAAG